MVSIVNMAREACITDPALLWAIILGNVGIFLACFWIALSAIRILSSQVAVPQPVLWMLKAALVISWGVAHVVAIIVIFRPYYGLEAGMLVLVAIVSLLAGAALHRAVPGIRQEVQAYAVLMEKARTQQVDLDRERAGRPSLSPPQETEP